MRNVGQSMNDKRQTFSQLKQAYDENRDLDGAMFSNNNGIGTRCAICEGRTIRWPPAHFLLHAFVCKTKTTGKFCIAGQLDCTGRK